MNELERRLMDRPSITPGRCAVCGTAQCQAHHIVPRSHGGASGPVVHLCGMGNATGCHGLAHKHRLHFRYTEQWEYLLTREPMKYEAALESQGWKPL